MQKKLLGVFLLTASLYGFDESARAKHIKRICENNRYAVTLSKGGVRRRVVQGKTANPFHNIFLQEFLEEMGPRWVTPLNVKFKKDHSIRVLRNGLITTPFRVHQTHSWSTQKEREILRTEDGVYYVDIEDFGEVRVIISPETSKIATIQELKKMFPEGASLPLKDSKEDELEGICPLPVEGLDDTLMKVVES